MIFTISALSSNIFETSFKVFPGITTSMLSSTSSNSLLTANLYPSNATKLSSLFLTSKSIPCNIGLASSRAIAKEVPFIIFFNKFCGTSTLRSSLMLGNAG